MTPQGEPVDRRLVPAPLQRVAEAGRVHAAAAPLRAPLDARALDLRAGAPARADVFPSRGLVPVEARSLVVLRACAVSRCAADLRATYRLQLGPELGFREARALVPVPARPRGQPPLPLAVAAGAQRARRTATTSSTRRGSPRSSAARRRSASSPRPGSGSCSTSSRTTWPRARRTATGAIPSWRASSSTSTGAPACTAASSTSASSPASAWRTRTSSRRRTRKCSRSSRDGLVDGLRDRPSGRARRPGGYLERLRGGGVEHVWVEKILEPGEQLRDWPVEGTTGYEFLNDVTALFVDPARRGAADARSTRSSRASGGRSRSSRSRRSSSRRATTFAARGASGCSAARRRCRTSTRALALASTSTAPTSSRGPGRSTPADREAIAAAGSPTRLERILLLEERGARRLRDALPADDRAGDGEGRRGHGLLPLVPARSRSTRSAATRRGSRCRRGLPPREPRARRSASRGTCSRRRRTTRSAARRARADRRARVDSRRVGERVLRWRELNAGLRGSARRERGVPDLPDPRRRLADRRRPARGLPREGDARGEGATRAGSSRTRSGRRACSASPPRLLEHRPFLDDFEPFAAAARARGASAPRSGRCC